MRRDPLISWRRPRTRAIRYAVAVAAVALAFLPAMAMESVTLRTPFVFFYAAVIGSALYGGLGPGLLATVLAMGVVDIFFFSPDRTFVLRGLADAVPLAAFGVVSYLISHVTESLRAQWAAADKRATELQREQAHVRALLESAGEGIYAIDLDGLCTLVNPAATAMLGYAESELLQRNVHDLIHHTSVDGRAVSAASCPILRTSQGGEQVQVADDVFWRKDGSAIPVDYVSAPIEEGGVITGAVVIFSDISERKRGEELQRFLNEASGRLAASLDYETTLATLAGLAVPVLGDRCIIDIFTGEELQSTTVAHVDPAVAERLRAARRRFAPSGQHPVLRVLRSGAVVRFADLSPEDWENAAEDAAQRALMRELKPAAGIALPLRARDRTLGVISFAGTRDYDDRDFALARDFAQRAALAVDNARLYRDAQAATRAREDVLAVVSHDLRNPIHTISMSASLLRELGPAASEDQMNVQLGVIRRSADRANRLIGDLLDATRIETGRMSVERHGESPTRLVAEAVEAVIGEARARKLTVAADADRALPDVWADRERVLQVLGNLLGNAIKFTPPGGRIGVAAEVTVGGVRFSVTDTGQGIPAEMLPHVFDRYWQGRRADRRGVGLGLSIAKGIVEAHGGTMVAESTPGQGSTFSFVLPVATAGVARADAQDVGGARRNSLADVAPGGAGDRFTGPAGARSMIVGPGDRSSPGASSSPSP